MRADTHKHTLTNRHKLEKKETQNIKVEEHFTFRKKFIGKYRTTNKETVTGFTVNTIHIGNLIYWPVYLIFYHQHVIVTLARRQAGYVHAIV